MESEWNQNGMAAHGERREKREESATVGREGDQWPVTNRRVGNDRGKPDRTGHNSRHLVTPEGNNQRPYSTPLHPPPHLSPPPPFHLYSIRRILETLKIWRASLG